jgi:MFS family permease
LIVRFWGKLADRKSWIFLMKVLIIIQAISHLLWFFTNGASAMFLIPLAHIFSGAAASGINIAVFNIQFNYAPENYKTIYIGFSSALGALMGFTGTLIGSVLIGRINVHQFYLGSLPVNRFQILFALSCMVLLGCFAFVNLSFGKREKGEAN